MFLSLIVPVFNEEDHIASVLTRVEEALLHLRDTGVISAYEIVVIDDGSSDKSPQVLNALQHSKELKIILCDTNQGKGSALQIGFKMAKGDFVLIQDADHEYDPLDYAKLIQEQKRKNADFVMGSRLLSKTNEFKFVRQKLANQFLSFVSSFLLGQRLTDIETCYKLIRRDLLLMCELNAKRFDIEIEISFELFRFEALVFSETAITYQPRSYDEGKKIGWKDGVEALLKILSLGLKNKLRGKRSLPIGTLQKN